jgi:hypothetical protein
MPVTYTYQETSVLTRIANDLILRPTMDDPVFKILPIRPRNSMNLRWIIRDNYIGLMKLRGLGGEPTRVNKVGQKVFETTAGVFGEFETVDEKEMTTRAAGFPADLSVPIDVKDLVAEAQEQLTARQISRMKQIAWNLLINGTISIALSEGGIGYSESYTQQAVTVSPLWSSTTTATPLVNLQDLQPTYGRGTSNMFNGMAEMWMNSKTANYLIRNRNSADLGGSRTRYGATFNDIRTINEILVDQNVPVINIWDDGYLDDSGTFQLYLPDGKVLVVGKRPDGELPGEFQITRNANNPDMGARAYAEVLNYTDGPAKRIPPTIQIHQGFNGGAVVERAKQLVIMTVA